MKKFINIPVSLVLVALAMLAAICLSSCSQMYTLNKAIRYEYELTRKSQTETNTHLKINNDDSH